KHFTRGAMAEMRALLVELRPDSLTKTDLGQLLGQLCDVFTGRTQIEVDKQISRNIHLPPNVQVAFYRVAQEALNNIVKHAQATRATLTFQQANDGSVALQITDNGVGFDMLQASPDHFGLQIIKERASEIEADCAIHSQPGQGTKIVLRKKINWEPVLAQ
ncbi:MAG TPA: ATP-binding protein, partial [Aggregatilineales bacterium]|nr:ATP-binding protein [Aggregatilineales bacterium]